ncbi:DUF6882 domain-containing protein [Stomatohabitans albus]|uniref:DUF6882 domain-containing protein n=1 Tax=Stomatohabitans albus TaxID=3110766 RepID=UPI00300D428F
MSRVLDLAGTHLPATLARGERFVRLVGDTPGILDLDDGRIQFGDKQWPIQIVGTTDTEAHAWVWAWADGQPFPEELTITARALRDMGKRELLPEFGEAIWHLDDIQPYVVAAIARGWGLADVLYRVPIDHRAIYVLMSDVTLPAPKAHELANALTTAIAMVPIDHRRATVDLMADARIPTTGVDEVVLATVPPSGPDGKPESVTITFTPQGKIADVGVVIV